MSENTASPASRPAYALVSLLILAVAIGAAFYCLIPPRVVPNTALATEFSASRAFEHLKVMKKTPSMAMCERCQIKFFTPLELLKHPVKAKENLHEQFSKHQCKPAKSASI